MTTSQEVADIIRYMARTGRQFTVTSTFRPGSITKAGYVSNHAKQGTGGGGLAVDFAGPDLLGIFAAFAAVESQLTELIYSGAPYNIKNGERVKPYAVAQHWDHVHVAVALGTTLKGESPAMADDPAVPNITPPVSFHPVVDSDGKCWGYYIFSEKTAEVHAWGDKDHVIYYGRSEVLTA